jgi:hypothetical protein
MAVAIRSIPTLQGEDAERFLKETDYAEKNKQKQNFGEKKFCLLEISSVNKVSRHDSC